jgi:5S rRNA maturation endonuclease (ribonuclease M5)
MKDTVIIYVEGKTDLEFLEKVWSLDIFGSESPEPKIVNCGGWGGLRNQQNTLAEGSELRGNLILFDADEDPDGRRKELQNILSDIHAGQNCHIFLFPDNQSQGSLETLLRRLATRPDFFNCWDSFQHCLSQLNGAYQPDEHQMVYAYEQAYLSKAAMKKARFQGDAQSLWNFSPSAEPLLPLLEFLSPFLR